VRKTPVFHVVKHHYRSGVGVGPYVRGTGSPTHIKKPVVVGKTVNGFDKSEWGVDTVYTHGIEGDLSIGKGYIAKKKGTKPERRSGVERASLS